MQPSRVRTRTRRSAAAVALTTAVSVVTLGAGVVSTGGSAAAAPSLHRAVAHSDSLARQRVDTRLGITAPAVADSQGRAVVSGRLTARGQGVADRPVRLLVKREGARRFTLGRVERTDRRGRVAFAVSPPVATTYRLAFFGSRVLQPARSAPVTVQERETQVSIAVSPGAVAPGASVGVAGVVTDDDVVLPGATVELRARKAGTDRAFEPIATAVSGADGGVSFTVTPTRSTTYVLVARPTATSQLARSRTATVTVAATTRIAVRARTIGETFSVVGVLRSGGEGLGGRVVQLQEQAAGATTWTTVRRQRTARDGYVDFRRPAVEGTSYRLLFAGTDRLATSTSRTVVA